MSFLFILCSDSFVQVAMFKSNGYENKNTGFKEKKKILHCVNIKILQILPVNYILTIPWSKLGLQIPYNKIENKLQNKKISSKYSKYFYIPEDSKFNQYFLLYCLFFYLHCFFNLLNTFGNNFKFYSTLDYKLN